MLRKMLFQRGDIYNRKYVYILPKKYGCWGKLSFSHNEDTKLVSSGFSLANVILLMLKQTEFDSLYT